MLRPTRHLDLNTCVVKASATILQQIQDHGPIKYEALILNLQDQLGENIRFQVGPSLGLLYLLGLVEYDDDSDVLYLTRKSQVEEASEAE